MRRDAFPAGYRASRATFVERARLAGGALDQYRHPLRGSDGETVAIDVASFGDPEAHAILIVVSGTHGVEGLCGAGVQFALLERGLPRSLAGRARLVLVHALNPHGFLDLHRTDERNVDLNRNFVAHDGSYPDDAAYAEVHGWLVPDDWDGPARAAADSALADYTAARGARALQAAVSGGQYSHPDGLFYGGREPAWSNARWREILRRAAGRATHVAVVDLHSGLGARGACELICGERPGSRQFAAAKSFFGDGLVFPGLDSTAPAAAGYMGVSLAEALPDVHGALVVAEFGTQPFAQVFDALRADNWVRVRGSRSHQRDEVREAMELAFVGRDADWQEAVLQRGYEICSDTLARLRDAAGGQSRYSGDEACVRWLGPIS